MTRTIFIGCLAALLSCACAAPCEGGEVTLKGDVTIGSSADLDGLQCVTAVEGDLNIESDIVRSLDSLERLQRVEGSLTIERAGSLQSLRGLDALRRIEGDLIIGRNALLRDLSGLDALTVVEGAVSISRNPSLEELTGLESLASVGGDLQVSDTAVRDLAVFRRLQSVSGVMQLSSNPRLKSLDGLGARSVGGLWVFDNAELQSIGGPKFSTAVAPGYRSRGQEDIHIFDNGKLESVALHAAPEGGVRLSRCQRLRTVAIDSDALSLLSLDELPALEAIDLPLSLVISDALEVTATGLTSLGGMRGINRVGCHVFVSRNPHLQTLGGLRPPTGYLSVRDCPELPSCEVDPWAELVRAGPAPYCTANSAGGKADVDESINRICH